MRRTNANRALLRTVALGQILLLVVAGCKSTSDIGTKAQVVNQSLVGKDGAFTVTDPNTVVNAYAALATDAVANDPNSTVTVASGGLSGLAAGDLVLIIQMAGATIDTADDSSAFGSVTTLGSAGNYELVGVTGFSANTITLGSNLQKSYTVAGKTQVIRVPQYSTLTINDGASIIAPAWNGTVGGVVALQAATTLDLSTSGKIDVSATGFRGGATHPGLNFTTDSDQPNYRSADPNDGAEKGESIAGDPNTLAFPYGRGAPANGGGGGNWHNAGGGGGANAAASGAGSDAGGPNWNGQGVMLSSVTGAAAWSLDPGYASSGGPGGGRGGYTYSALNGNALADPPGDAASWGGNSRRERGGLGGHPLTSSPAGRLFLGGGGGAGDGNNTFPGPGGRGGGLVFVIAGTVAGSGSILANGADGGNSNSNGNASGDAPGGGGGGGTVVVHVSGTLPTAIVIRANGGAGGNQININSNAEAEGPGGGGGGGYVALSGTAPTTVSVSGGLGGTTSASNGVTSALSEFPSNGATAGQAGLIDNTAASSMVYRTNPDVTIDNHPSDPTTVAAGTFAFSSHQSGVTYECNLDGAGYATCSADYTTEPLDPGSHTLVVRAKDLNGNPGTPSDSFPWHVLAAGDLDGGIDAEAEEAGAADVAALDVPPVIPEAGTTGLDAGEGLDGVVLLDAGEDSNSGSQDGLGTGLLDAAVRMDVAVVAADVPPVKLDASANGADTNGAEDTNGDGNELEVSAPQDAQGVVVVEPPSSDAAGAADQAVSPVLDAAGTTIADAAVPGPDAALPSLKAMGGGFCAVSPMRDSAPGLFTFFLLAAFGLLVLRRRR